MTGNGEDMEEDNRQIETLKTSIVIESISRSSSLVKLSLCNVVFGEHCSLEDFLSCTRTLLDFTYWQDYSTMAYATAQSIGRGFAKNKSVVKQQWTTPVGIEFMGEGEQSFPENAFLFTARYFSGRVPDWRVIL